MNKMSWLTLMCFVTLAPSWAFANKKPPVNCFVSGKTDGQLDSSPMKLSSSDSGEWIFELDSPGKQFHFKVDYTEIDNAPYMRMTINRQVGAKTLTTVLNSHSTNVDLYSGELYDVYSMRCE